MPAVARLFERFFHAKLLLQQFSSYNELSRITSVRVGATLVRFPNSLGCELGERRSYSLWIELPGPIVQKKIIGSGKMGTESESSTQNLGILISQTFKNSISSAAERHFSLPPVCHFFGRPDIREVFVFNKFRICEKLHSRFLPWFPDRFALNSGGNALKFILNQRNIDLSVRISIKKRPFSAFFT